MSSFCFIWTFVYFCCSLFDFCAVYFTTKTLFVHYCALFIRWILKISLRSSLSTQSVCHTISPRVGVAESESEFGTVLESGVLNFLTPESESESHKKQGLYIRDYHQWMPLTITDTDSVLRTFLRPCHDVTLQSWWNTVIAPPWQCRL